MVFHDWFEIWANWSIAWKGATVPRSFRKCQPVSFGTRSRAGFIVPMHAPMRKKACHEPEGRARQSPARRLRIAKLRRARSDAPYRFIVPMHAKKRKRAFHEPTFPSANFCCICNKSLSSLELEGLGVGSWSQVENGEETVRAACARLRSRQILAVFGSPGLSRTLSAAGIRL